MSSENISRKAPTPEELQREVEQFFKEKYGNDNVQARVDSLGTKATDIVPEDKEPDLNFTMTPIELESYLKQYVVRQEEAIEVLATKVATHFNRMRWEKEDGKDLPKIPGQIKPNIIMIGPTGVGKTYIIKLIADRLGVPFVKGDATKFSETGYVGGDVEDMVRDLVRSAGGNIKQAEYGIIYIDEIDKIAASQSVNGPDVSRTGVQRNLLKMMEETEVEMRVPHDLASQMEAVVETQKTGKAPQKKVNTRNILFIVSGAFNGLDKIIKKRMNKQPIGFGGDIEITTREYDQIISETRTQDLMEYGFESEFIGRLPVLAHLQELDEDGLFEILTNDYNAVVQGKIRDFAAYGIDLTFTNEALRIIARRACEEKTGARGLTRATEKILIPFEKRLPSTCVKKFTITKEAVEKPLEFCLDLIFGETVDDAVEKFKEQTNVKLKLSSAAKRWLQENIEDGETPGSILLNRLSEYHYAFNLLGKDEMQVTASLLDNPKEYLESLIKKSYREE
jgi:ATP-dependent Clp protease ATP-binding subunit ClpX